MLANAEVPLPLPTYDGSGQCVHPDVISGSDVCGSSLIMVMEPYPYGDARLENPSLLLSEDGYRWAIPPGVRNPVVDLPDDVPGWHSDAVLLAPRSGSLWLYYRYNSGAGETTLYLRRTFDGRTWSPGQAVAHEGVSGRFASPSVVVASDGTFKMFSVDTLRCVIEACTSRDGVSWSERSDVLAFPEAWHVCARAVDGWMHLLINDRQCLYLLRGRPAHRWQALNGGRWTTLRPDGAAPPLLAPSRGGWDDGFIYHGTFAWSGETLRVWYSARSSDGRWRIGCTSGGLR